MWVVSGSGVGDTVCCNTDTEAIVMGVKPDLPDSFQVPREVNGWRYDPEHRRNGYVWVGGSAAVRMFLWFDKWVGVRVYDDRLVGFGDSIQVSKSQFREGESRGKAARRGVEMAVDWMKNHDPGGWSHPDAVEAVFDPPSGLSLAGYSLGSRKHTVIYRDDEGSVLDNGYSLHVVAWRGSGNSRIYLEDKSDIHEKELDVVEPPEECGLEVALKMAHDWVEDQEMCREISSVPTGQTGLEHWGDSRRSSS